MTTPTDKDWLDEEYEVDVVQAHGKRIYATLSISAKAAILKEIDRIIGEDNPQTGRPDLDQIGYIQNKLRAIQRQRASLTEDSDNHKTASS